MIDIIQQHDTSDLEKRLVYQANILKDLHAVWQPHEAQVEIGKALFYDGKQYVFCQCGRKFGKTDIAVYSGYRAATTTPNAAIYYIAPFQKQAKELIWANNRLQNFLPPEMQKKYIKGINNQEMRIRFHNGSFIKLDGADNYEAYRGINPHFIIYDEFKDHHPKFHEGMEPNLATYSAPLMVIGTPPETEDNLYTKLARSYDRDPDGAFFRFPSWSNPHIDKKWLERTKERLIERGEWDVWAREYEARQVKGGQNAIFPMFDREKHIMPHKEILDLVKRERKRFEFYITADPATSSVFGVLFTAIHKYTRQVLHLDELYVRETRDTSARKILPRIQEICRELHPIQDDWMKTHDEAAAWWQNEVIDISKGEWCFQPTRKAMNKKDAGLSLIKDQMLYGFWKASDRCKNLFFEIENCVRDDKGKVKKENDHLIDCMRYTNSANHYSHIEARPEEPRDPHTAPRYSTLSDEWHHVVSDIDWTTKVLGDEYYD